MNLSGREGGHTVEAATELASLYLRSILGAVPVGSNVLGPNPLQYTVEEEARSNANGPSSHWNPLIARQLPRGNDYILQLR